MAGIRPRRVGAVVVALLLAGGAGYWWASRPPPLTGPERQTWQQFLDKQLSSTVSATSAEASAVAALGDKVVPLIEENLGKAYTGPGGKGDYWLVVALARIGTEKAKAVILKVLRHDYPGKVGLDREIAASALVWLGATETLPDLQQALADTQRLLVERIGGRPGPLQREELKPLQSAIGQLEAGQGKRSTANFPFD